MGICITEWCGWNEKEGRKEKMKEAYCRWYEKPMRELAEHEQEQCAENGQKCEDCPDLILQEKERQAGNEEL